MKSPTKPRTAGVRKMWADKPNYGDLRVAKTLGKLGGTQWDPYPVAVVDLRPASMEALVEVGAKALARQHGNEWYGNIYGSARNKGSARAVLAAVFKTRGMGK